MILYIFTYTIYPLIASGTWTSCLVGGLEDTATWADHSSWNWEGDLRVMKLSDVWSLAVSCLDGSRLNDGDGTMSSTVSTSHFLVHLFYSAVKCGISVLLVCIVHSSTRVISNPDAIILNGCWVLLKDFVHCENLTVGLLYTTKLSQEVPEL